MSHKGKCTLGEKPSLCVTWVTMDSSTEFGSCNHESVCSIERIHTMRGCNSALAHPQERRLSTLCSHICCAGAIVSTAGCFCQSTSFFAGKTRDKFPSTQDSHTFPFSGIDEDITCCLTALRGCLPVLWWYSQQVHAECSQRQVGYLGLTFDVWRRLEEMEQHQECNCHIC